MVHQNQLRDENKADGNSITVTTTRNRGFDILKYYNVHHGLMTCVTGDGYTTLNSSDRKRRNKILFVDDDPDTTWISKTALEHNGSEVQTFESPILALDNFKPRLYHLLLVDIKMRDMDGSNFMMK